MLATNVLSPVCNTKSKLHVSTADNLHENLPVVESLGGVNERNTADCFAAFDSDITDDILASIDLPSSVLSSPISSAKYK